jgi:hypothetical protein
LEVIMLTRRIVMSACALCIAIPSAASASAATDPSKPIGPAGITTTIDPSTIAKAKGPYGVTLKNDPPNLVKAKGPYGITATIDPKTTVKAKGPYGTTLKTASQNTTRATAHPTSASSSDGVNDWRTAAISEGALLAALALGSAWLLSARRHAPRLGT